MRREGTVVICGQCGQATNIAVQFFLQFTVLQFILQLSLLYSSWSKQPFGAPPYSRLHGSGSCLEAEHVLFGEPVVGVVI